MSSIHLPSLKNNSKFAPENRPGPKRKRESLPTIQGQNLSFRECMSRTMVTCKKDQCVSPKPSQKDMVVFKGYMANGTHFSSDFNPTYNKME